jgi:acetyltransferase EpsM
MINKKIVIIGGGGHAGIILDCIKAQNKYQPIGYLDKKKGNFYHEDIKYLGDIDNFFKNIKKKYKNEKLYFTIAIGDNFVRKKIYFYLIKNKKLSLNWATLIHPSASISSKVKIAKGAQILNGSIISFNTKISKLVCINTGATIDHDNYFASFSGAGPGACTGGNVKVGEISFLGINSSVKHNINIGKNVIVGGNSFVNSNCEANSVYVGVPARKIKSRSENDSYL